MFKGSIVALVTPFDKQGKVDLDSLARLVSYHVEQGTDGILCLGTTGEASTLSEEEREMVIKTVIQQTKKQIPVIAGTGTNSTLQSIEYTKKAQQLGVDACLVVIPYYNKPNAVGCLSHFKEIDKLGLPIMLYHNPARTGIKLSLDSLLSICDLPNVVAVKECSSDLDLVFELTQKTPKTILAGDDSYTLPMMLWGAKGICSVVANLVPKKWKEMVTAYEKNNVCTAKKIMQDVFPLCKALFLESNPQCVKYAMSLLNLCPPYLRLPLVLPSEDNQKKIKKALESYLALQDI
ncbi:MAG: 4-hydroxy-tetrahydrodipicolinate synthase [Rhabdochlamydiaceae bacterium]